MRSLGILIGFIIFSALACGVVFLKSFTHKSPYVVYAIQGLQVVCVALCTVTLRRLLKLCLWGPYESRFQKPPPHILVSGINLIIITLGVIISVVFVFEKSIGSIGTATGFMTAGLAIALQGLIYDGFSGFVVDLDKPYKVGDWVKASEFVGQVTEIGWRSTTIMTAENIMIRIPNSMLLNRELINYSRPEPHYMENVMVAIDHHIPIDRVKRILHAAVINTPYVYKNRCIVHALKSTSGGIDYQVCFAIKHCPDWRDAKHHALLAMQRAVHENGFKFSETIGEYTLSRGGARKEVFQEIAEAKDVLKETNLFKYVAPSVLDELASHLRVVNRPADDVIIQQGDTTTSMFILVEGAIGVFLSHEGKELDEPVAILNPKQFFGDRSLLLGEPRSATVKSLTDTMIIEITKEDFEPFIQSHPEVIEHISKMVAERDLQNQKRLADHAQNQENLESITHKISQSMRLLFGLAAE